MIDNIDLIMRKLDTIALFVAKQWSKHQRRSKREQSIRSAVVFVTVAF